MRVCGGRWFANVSRFSAIALVALSAVPLPLVAAELTAKVRSVGAGGLVTLRTEAGTPRVGDPVTLGFEAPGVGFVALEGQWEVSLIGPGGEIQALPTTAGHGQPQSGYVAKIDSRGGGPIAGAGSPPPKRAVAEAGPPGQAGLPGVADRAYLGVRVQNPPEGSGAQGVEVVAVAAGSPAAAAGIRVGDWILAANGRATPASVDLTAALGAVGAGQALPVRILRFPEVLELNVVSARAPAQQPANPAPRAAPRPPSTVSPPPRAVGHATYLAGTESGNRSGLFTVAGGIRADLAAKGVYLRELPPEVAGSLGIGRPKEWLVAQARNLGGSHLLYLTLQLKWTHMGMGKDRLRVSCLDAGGQTLWSEDASNFMAQSPAGSLQRVVHKIADKLEKRMGGPCLSP